MSTVAANRRLAERRAANRAAGLCACGAEPRPGWLTCEVCAASNARCARRPESERGKHPHKGRRARVDLTHVDWSQVRPGEIRETARLLGAPKSTVYRHWRAWAAARAGWDGGR